MSGGALLLGAGLALQALLWLLALGSVVQGTAWATLALIHALSALLLGLGAAALLPTARPRAAALLFGSLCLVLPGLGALALWPALWHLRGPGSVHEAPPSTATLALPAFDGNLGHIADLRVLGMARRALRRSMPASRKLQALMSLQTLPSAEATGLLRQALRDADDEVRLVAYTLMDRQEQALTGALHALQAQLADAPDARQQHTLRCRQVELHLELLHRDLAQGGWREQLIGQALDGCARALQHAPQTASLHLQRARLHALRGQTDAATAALQRALHLGAAPSRTLPYLAEQAWQARDPARVRLWLAQLDASALSPRLQRLRAFWVNRHA